MAGEMIGTLVGNLTADPVLETSQGGQPYARFRIASTPRVKRGGEFVDGEAMFVACTAFGRMAENVMASFSRGTRVFVHGRVTHHTWTTQEGANRTDTQMAVDHCGPEIFFDPARHAPRQQGQGGGGQQQGGWQGGGQQAAQPGWSQGGGQPPAGPPQGGQQGAPPSGPNPWEQGGQQGGQPPQGGAPW